MRKWLEKYDPSLSLNGYNQIKCCNIVRNLLFLPFFLCHQSIKVIICYFNKRKTHFSISNISFSLCIKTLFVPFLYWNPKHTNNLYKLIAILIVALDFAFTWVDTHVSSTKSKSSTSSDMWASFVDWKCAAYLNQTRKCLCSSYVECTLREFDIRITNVQSREYWSSRFLLLCSYTKRILNNLKYKKYEMFTRYDVNIHHFWFSIRMHWSFMYCTAPNDGSTFEICV